MPYIYFDSLEHLAVRVKLLSDKVLIYATNWRYFYSLNYAAYYDTAPLDFEHFCQKHLKLHL